MNVAGCTQDAPENKDASASIEDGPPEHGFLESAADFGLPITTELDHCCRFGAKSDFQDWLAQLNVQSRKDVRSWSARLVKWFT